MDDRPRILDITAAVTLITALVYTAGWSYAYHWYDRFELGLIGLGIPFEYHFMYGFWVLQTFWWLIPTLVVFLALTYWAQVDPVLDLLARTALIWGLLAFVLFYYMGKAAAGADYRDHRESGFQSYPWVRIWTISDQGQTSAEPQTAPQDLADGKYRLLLQTTQSLYLIRPRQDSGQLPTLQIPHNQIRALRRIPTNPGRSGASSR
ncbi:hypothetical protein [Candidatus Thiosymbion oneisti]|uniref:hypothetical protein n=1 Tax=Candidatus Thiosymbion oneisti TaxID=589554 RepID=UPI000B7D9099|nr:hypothetical protein [Candidatus Thiosymbion oneisti]